MGGWFRDFFPINDSFRGVFGLAGFIGIFPAIFFILAIIFFSTATMTLSITVAIMVIIKIAIEPREPTGV
jgi:hypothetical protein